MSIKYNDKTNNREILLAGISPVDQILSGTSKNAIANKAVYNALKEKIEKTVSDLVNYYTKSDVYNKAEVRALISTISTMDIQVVNALPTEDISTTTIYFLKPAGATTYDEYVYINNAWVKIGTTDLDLSQYVTNDALTLRLADYCTKAEITTLLTDYAQKADVYDKDAVDDLLDAKQDSLTFDSTPTAGSSNPVTSDGIKTAIGAKKFSNPNLLDNGWFTVNQRGQTTYTNGYSLDRWSIRGTSKIDVISDGITFTSLRNDGVNDSWIRELISVEEASLLIGKTLTYSVLTTDGVVASWTLTLTSSNWSGAYKTVNGVQIRPTIEWGTEYVSILLWSKTYNVGLDIRAIKFEIGSESTLDLDTAPDYAIELAKCRTSTVDSTDTFANQGQINVGTSNPNLLDNPWFTVNQRGRSTYPNSMNGFSVDRWYKNLNINLDVIDNGVRLTKKATSNPTLYQKIEASPYLLGKTVTLSVMTTDGKIRSCTGTFPTTFPSSGNTIVVNFDDDVISFRLQAVSTFNPYFIATLDTENCAIDGYLDIRAVKLELGTVSTLAMDTAPNYQQELAKCQRYFVRFKSNATYSVYSDMGYVVSATEVRTPMNLPVSMRQSPTVTTSGSLRIFNATDYSTMSQSITSVSGMGFLGSKLMLKCVGTGFISGKMAMLAADNDADTYIDFSADL